MSINNIVALSQDTMMININEYQKPLDVECSLYNVSQDILDDKFNKVCQMVQYEILSLYDYPEYISIIKDIVSQNPDKSSTHLSQIVIELIHESQKPFIYKTQLPWSKISFAAAIIVFLISKFLYSPKHNITSYLLFIVVLISVYAIGIFRSQK